MTKENVTRTHEVLTRGQHRVEELFARAQTERHLGVKYPDIGGYTEGVKAGFRVVANAQLRSAQERLHRLLWGLL